ncbi:sulfatase, partial [bacterium]
MKRRELLKGLAAGAATLALDSKLWAQAPAGTTAARPNILWLTIEDTSAYEFGCYGNSAVKTPIIDGLAAKGVRYTHAWAAGPQCSPSRASIITGSFGTTYGMDWHRHQVEVPGGIFYPPVLREAGYFCTNNAKTDYNATVTPRELWDENGAQATYNSAKRGANQPFFAVFNCGATHMSRLRSFTLEGRRDFVAEGLDPQKLALPPHVPDLPEVRSYYAFHLEGVQDIDGWVGSFLEDLEARGLAEDTIVFFCSDHGGCLPRGKGFLYRTGLQVPLIAY